ncbi:TDP-N-acetylfucosamine:lipid II N-acetylfucosaminyltransferase [Mesobacillus subterraneus]|uniref:TDP-N-acetylfucosamine:lipid II N-acetylfucosaminyltransferase n=1 Tax=Mesobacillus subterraneus TaxID=285983 RepID=UPI001CFE0F8A|nr:TDP-N-acetylfucosamine:lipid II N-acetylfucosaminyltransferase [Mesobacillus subterraneus]WLR55469.1 TDP-N-acetylfucosamine:lipid II N-acetylfucosaminyltransferase [Mesobacillus subterraneus]
MKHFHFVGTEKFTEPYIKFINLNFNGKEHGFHCVESNTPNYMKESFGNFFKYRNVWNKSLIRQLYRADKVYIHGLFDFRIIALFFFQPWLLQKCHWIIWGADLYTYRQSRKNMKSKIKEAIRAFIIKRFGNIVTLVKGDYKLVQKWYRTNANYYHGAYINPISQSYLDSLPQISEKSDDVFIIQIGNSADIANKHIEALRKIVKFRDENIQIFVPLSYGDKTYQEQVIREGKKLFGHKFKALTEFLPPEEYSAYLNEIDIAIFNNDRQQALGNIYALLYLNKKVYIRSDTAMWEHFKEKFDIDMNDFLSVDNINFDDFTKRANNDLKIKISKVFDKDYLVDIWKVIFEGRNNK